jgi:hypothetical protein
LRKSAGASANSAMPAIRNRVSGSFSTRIASASVTARLNWISGAARLTPIACAARKLQ